MPLDQSASSCRRIISTSASVLAEALPHAAPERRSLLVVRTWSQRITLGVFNPPSGGITETRDEILFDLSVFDVRGTTITKPDKPVLNWSSLTISTGRHPRLFVTAGRCQVSQPDFAARKIVHSWPPAGTPVPPVLSSGSDEIHRPSSVHRSSGSPSIGTESNSANSL